MRRIQNQESQNSKKRKIRTRKEEENKKEKLLKMKKIKGTKRKTGNSRQIDSCQTLDCLNNLVQTLKVENNTVRNFLNQQKGVDSKLKLMSKQLKCSKLAKNQNLFRKQTGQSRDRWDTVMYKTG